ncbi:MAG: hypothetical protein HYY20_04680 [Candidatus Tectomicrobia bacterium]|uniref:Uncharacterized protein n=1 Tax=Tectimicrobiota bacterium TaxID=2528274 RepID=A0A932CNE7_UNCTE|nr:hypothetical protein [Candidatus Tectomicrobia bacterium]
MGLVLVLTWLLGQGVGWGAVGKEFVIVSFATEPALAYDPANQRFLMVYDGYRNLRVQGQLLNAEGNRVGANFPISSLVSDECCVRAKVVYDSVNRRFLVVWTQMDSIWGQLVNADGTLLGTNLAISTSVSLKGSPTAAYDPVSQSFLVVWTGDLVPAFGGHIYGRRMGADGSLLGDEIAIDKETGMQSRPRVDYDSVNQRFLVAYHDGDQISGRLVGADGSLVGAKFQIATSVEGPDAVVYDTAHGRFLVVWSTGDDYHVWGQLVNADGTPFLGKLRISTTAPPIDFSVAAAYDPARQRFLVVWLVWSTDPWKRGYYGQQVNPDGTLFLDRELLLPTTADTRYASALAYDAANQRFLMAWETYNGETTFRDIYGLLLAGLPLRPLALLSLNAESFRPGDPLNLDVRVLTPPHASPAGHWSFEAAAWLKTPLDPPADLLSLLNIGGPGHPVTLPPGSDLTYPLLHLPVIPPVPAGSYRFGIRLNHPITLEEMSLEEMPFEVISP